MPLKSYSVLKGRAKAKKASLRSHPHYHLLLTAHGCHYRVAVNVRSMLQPPEMEYLLKFRFRHPILEELTRLSAGLHRIPHPQSSLALDFIRLNLFHRDQMLSLPSTELVTGADLSEVLDGLVGGAISDPDAWVYAFGEPWEAEAADCIFRFHPSRGIHEVHMNQGNDPCHVTQDGVWQDGGLLIEHPTQQRWTALFLKFQSQSWQTNEQSGHALLPSSGADWMPFDNPAASHPEGRVRIIAALVAPLDGGPEAGAVTLVNISPCPVEMTGWKLLDGGGGSLPLAGLLLPGEFREIPVDGSLGLSPRGGIVTLLDRDGIKVHGISYTAEQAARTGWRIAF